MSLRPGTPQYTSQEVKIAVSSRREKIDDLKKQMLTNPALEATLMPQVSALLTEIGHYQAHEVKDKE